MYICQICGRMVFFSSLPEKPNAAFVQRLSYFQKLITLIKIIFFIFFRYIFSHFKIRTKLKSKKSPFSNSEMHPLDE